MRLFLAISAAAIAAIPVSAVPGDRQARPVMIAGNGDFDACLSTATVNLTKPGAALSVRSGPSTAARERARLRHGQMVWTCDISKDGKWTGIVYHPLRQGEESLDCDLGPSETPRRPYRGDCQSGWVASRYLLSLAG